MFYGLGSDGTVGANKNSIKIIGEDTDNYAQGYFVYDSKKSGSITMSHLRFGPRADPLDLPGHQGQLRRLPPAGSSSRSIDMLKAAVPGGTFLLNTPYGPDEVWDKLPAGRPAADHRQEDQVLRHRRLQGGQARPAWAARINTIMQTCFFAISGVLPQGRGDRRDQEIDQEDLRQEGRRDRPDELRRPWTRRWRTCIEVKVPADGHEQDRRCRRWFRRRRRSSSKTCIGRDHRRRAATACR